MFKYEIGEKVYVRDADNYIMDGHDAVIINRDIIADIEVYTIVDDRGWSTAYRVENLFQHE